MCELHFIFQHLYLILCHVFQGLLTREKVEVETLDKILKNKNIPEGHQDAFKNGFAEGFLKAQALTQRTQGTCLHTDTSMHTLSTLCVYILFAFHAYYVFCAFSLSSHLWTLTHFLLLQHCGGYCDSPYNIIPFLFCFYNVLGLISI